MSENTGTPEAGATTTESAEPAAPQIDLSPVTDQLQLFESRFGAVEQALADRQPQPEPEDPYAGLESYAALLGEPEPEPQADPQQVVRTLADIADQRAQRAYEQNVNPQLQQVQQQLAEMRAERDLNELRTQYPDLQKPEVHDAVADRVNRVMSQLPPGVPATKEMVAMAYQAWQAEQMAAGEGSAQASSPSLESPSGAGPEGQEPDWNARVLQGRAQSKGVDFWGIDAL